ncbi:hypothetical protein [Streptomyces californicus]|uniref:hypothetical protein n=1 Tax=Streptomyces californicus TaxID=67351 RepID=UPI0033D1A9AA|nr:membrane protein [Streptomyces phage SoJo]
MTPLAQRTYVPSLTVAFLGTVTAAAGVLLDHYDVWRMGLLGLIASIPVLCYCIAHRATQASDDQLAETHSAGYRLALQHVHLGLLDTPDAPPDGGEGAEEDDTQGISIIRIADLPGNVRPFRPRDDEEDDNRKAI